jgi:class 3 adenylate cyclase
MKPVERTWSWEFTVPPAALWPLIADTNRLNEAGRGPKYRVEERPRADGSVERIATARQGPLRLVWEEPLSEWVANRVFTQRRLFKNGPLLDFRPTFALEPTSAGTRVVVTFRAAPRNLLGAAILRFGFFQRMGAIIDRLVREAGAFAEGRRETPFTPPAIRLAAGAGERAAAIAERLEGEGYERARRLADLVLAAPEADLERIRPKALARLWAMTAREAIELCLAAAKAGLLDLRWDLLCPRCRGAKASVGSLDLLPTGAHCPSCNIDYGRDFARNVEATFRPSAALREIESGGYCLASPLATEHVVVQQTLAPGERREIAAALPLGRYRVRTVEPGDEVEVDHSGDGFPEAIVDGAAVTTGAPAPAGTIVLRNEGTLERTVAIETRDWVADALTAHEVTTLQAFRDLFAAEALRPGDEVAIRQVTLMFTDLEGSTALYSRVGDARAYHVVREHYAFLARTIREHDGAIVKTIGDAVMAAFAEPASGLATALAVQRDVPAFNRTSEAGPIAIKLGLHAGPCIAVTLNERLDYFGTTVNLAARLQGESQGGDIVLSEEIVDDPAASPLVAGAALAAETAPVKGFADPVRFWRLRTTPTTSADAA